MRPHIRRYFQILIAIFVSSFSTLNTNAQGAKQTTPQEPMRDSDRDHVKERNEWFFRGRVVPGMPSAELRRRAYQTKMQLRAQRAAAETALSNPNTGGFWTPLGPLPLASDATGNGTQDYRQVSGRATAVVIDPADTTGNTAYIGGAQSGIWKSSNAAASDASSVQWTPLTDSQATLSIGAIAIQPGNSDPAKTVILAATGEADNSGDSYFGLGMLLSTDAGQTWTLIPTANNGAFSFSGLGGTRMAFGGPNAVVAAMATTSEGLVAGAVTANTKRGLYTSLDAGQTWTYNGLSDPGGPIDPTSATTVIYNAGAGKFFAAVRYHGFYSSPDGITWTRLVSQPGGTALSTTNCPPQSTSNNRACPIYRAELTVVPGRNEMYAWYVSFSSAGSVVDGGIWQSVDGGSSWGQISDDAITNCGDFEGCGAEQGFYNLELLAMSKCPGGVPTCTGNPTDLYAGAINLYKCSLPAGSSPVCSAGFLNLTHVYGCNPIGAPAHVHPDQHALASTVPSTGSDSGNALMYFANDGGIYRALDGFRGLTTGSCSGTNLFDDLNQNLGSMTQFVSFSQHPTDANTLLGGTQDNGSPATSQAMSNPAWGNVLGGDGGYNAIDPGSPTNFYATNPDVPPGGLGVQLCSNGVNCIDSTFSFVATSSSLGGDDGAFYFPFILDPQSSPLLIGTCRIWRGPRTGGAFTALSPNFDTLGSGSCSGSEVNQVRAIAARGLTDNNGSQVIYATTSGLGPIDGPLHTPAGGRVWVTTSATIGIPGFADTTNNGPAGNINPNQFPISGVAIDASVSTGAAAYVTVMGFTGGAGHVWKTFDFGDSWNDFTGNLPDSPVNSVLVDGFSSQVYVGTDVGAFVSSTGSPNWSELGPASGSGALPNAAVTALAMFNAGGQKLLRVSTYGRGIWQYPLIAKPDYSISISNPSQSAFAGQTATYNGGASAFAGYANSINLTCASGTTAPPSTCNIAPSALTPGNSTPFTLTAGGATGDYNFAIRAVGSDSQHITHQSSLTLHVIDFGLTAPSPTSISAPHGTTSSPVNFQATAAGSFNQAVNVSCSTTIPNAVCNLSPGTTVYPTSTSPVNMTATVSVPANAVAGSYPVTIQATTSGASASATVSFTLVVTTNSDFVLTLPAPFPEVNVGSTGTSGPIVVSSQDGFSGIVALSCPTTYGAGSCSISPTSVSTFPATATLTINGTSFSPGSYSLSITGTSGSTSHSISVSFNVGDYAISGTQTLALAPGGQGTATLTFTSSNLYAGKINATCDATALAGAQCVLSPPSPVTLSSGGSASLNVIINTPKDAANGTYNISLSTQDTTGAPSHKFSVVVSIGEDFHLTSSTSSQSVNPGQTTGAYNLTIQPVGSSFDAAVTLGCSGLPARSQCAFNPSTAVTPGKSAANVIMTISTTAPSSAAQSWMGRSLLLYGACFLFPMLCVIPVFRRQRVEALAPLCLMMILALASLPACSGVSSGGGGDGGGNPGTPPGTYTVTVTGTASGTPADSGQSVKVTLVVN